jgi:phage-related protein (TIGR01555 family)
MTTIIDHSIAAAETVLDALVSRADAYINDLVGMGGSKDPSVYTTARSRQGVGLPDSALEALFIEDDMAAKIVCLVVRHSLRTGWDLTLLEEPEKAAAIRKAVLDLETELGVGRTLALGAVAGRLWGGAVTWIGIDDGQGDGEASRAFLERQASPLDLEQVKRVRFLHTFDRRVLTIESYYMDPTSPLFGRPSRVRIAPRTMIGRAYESDGNFVASLAGGVVVHESRLLLWPGAETDENRRIARSGWDDSVLERAWDPLRAAAEDFGAKSMLLNRVSQFVFKLKNLAALIVSNESRLQRRLSLLDAQRARGRALVIDAEESAEQITQPISGLDVVIDKSVERVAIAGGVPPSVFVGRPTETDQVTWDEELTAYRREVMRPRHERIVELILRSKEGPVAGAEPATWDVVYNPLREPKPKERAEIRKLRAETDAIEIDKGIIPPEAVSLHRHTTLASGEGEVPLDSAEVRAALERRRELAKQPPKDNAELGTVAARATSAAEVVSKVATRQISRETGLELLVQFFRLTPEDATRMLGPETFEPAPPPSSKPGPAPEPRQGVGAGAPQGLPGFSAGGDPKASPPPADPQGRP